VEGNLIQNYEHEEFDRMKLLFFSGGRMGITAIEPVKSRLGGKKKTDTQDIFLVVKKQRDKKITIKWDKRY